MDRLPLEVFENICRFAHPHTVETLRRSSASLRHSMIFVTKTPFATTNLTLACGNSLNDLHDVSFLELPQSYSLAALSMHGLVPKLVAMLFPDFAESSLAELRATRTTGRVVVAGRLRHPVRDPTPFIRFLLHAIKSGTIGIPHESWFHFDLAAQLDSPELLDAFSGPTGPRPVSERNLMGFYRHLLEVCCDFGSLRALRYLQPHAMEHMRLHGDPTGLVALAARTGQAAVLAALADEFGVPLHQPQGSAHHTPLHLASQNGHAGAVAVLVARLRVAAPAALCALDAAGRSPLHFAAASGDEGVLEALLAAPMPRGAIEVQDEQQGMTPLAVAAGRGHVGAVGMLLKAGADVDAKNGLTGETAMHAAAARWGVGVMEVLVRAGAEINEGDYHGRTPYDAAAEVVMGVAHETEPAGFRKALQFFKVWGGKSYLEL
ncbi:hypothetical protein HDU96_009256 [Phlyctochytrium bullatum]|nr:hypothetical protein HDU96_009256 [Phlyctochytrium bullatum]